MALTALYADPYTRAELGPSGLVELSRNLWVRNCQTCGDPLGDTTPALVVFEQPESIEASLHHPQCCPPQWTKLPRPYDSSTATDSIRIAGLPQPDGRLLPILLINPALERVPIQCDAMQQWTVTTVADWARFGLRPPVDGLLDTHTTTMNAWYQDGVLTVKAGETHWNLPITNSAPEITKAMIERGGIMVVVTTALDPAAMTDAAPLNRVTATADAACGYIPFDTTTTPPGQPDNDPRRAEGIHHKPGDAFHDLPVEFYRGPSYNPSTGAFEFGMGPDGRVLWHLHDPGGQVHNGLLVGPPECGKTNSLNIIAIEAAHSGRFVAMIADPQDSNGHKELIGRTPWGRRYFADNLTGTTELLRALDRMIDYRKTAGGFITPTEKLPGVLLLIEDAHTVFRDPDIAALGERIVTDGPPVCIGIVATTETLDRGAFGNNLNLILHLGSINGQFFSDRALAQMRVYRSRQST